MTRFPALVLLYWGELLIINGTGKGNRTRASCSSISPGNWRAYSYMVGIELTGIFPSSFTCPTRARQEPAPTLRGSKSPLVHPNARRPTGDYPDSPCWIWPDPWWAVWRATRQGCSRLWALGREIAGGVRFQSSLRVGRVGAGTGPPPPFFVASGPRAWRIRVTGEQPLKRPGNRMADT